MRYPGIAYVLYLVWLLAGTSDFVAHRRSNLARTSGVPESMAHLLQLALVGLAVLVGMAFEIGRITALVLLALVTAHAIVGYLDTRIAVRSKRVISPIEQHLHSVLDMAPPIGFGWAIAVAWPALAAGDWTIDFRAPRLSASTWVGILAPAGLLCVAPAVVEFITAWRARHQSPLSDTGQNVGIGTQQRQ
jgi:hypothetical protein